MQLTAGDSTKKKKKIFPSILHLLTFIYGLLYLFVVIMESSQPTGASYSGSERVNLEVTLVIILFVVFLIGFFISWKREGIAGLIFILWWIGMWYLALFVVEHDHGAGVVMGIPLFILGIGFIILWYNKRKAKLSNPS
jgi:lysylphosphatidylglycerol synthetase-like protein (DUF2156 family)